MVRVRTQAQSRQLSNRPDTNGMRLSFSESDSTTASTEPRSILDPLRWRTKKVPPCFNDPDEIAYASYSGTLTPEGTVIFKSCLCGQARMYSERNLNYKWEDDVAPPSPYKRPRS